MPIKYIFIFPEKDRPICNRSLKLSKIAPSFANFWPYFLRQKGL